MNKFLNNLKQSFIKDEPISSFSFITLRVSGMRFTYEDEILMKDDMAELTRYRIVFGQGKDNKEVELKTLCDKERIIKLLNDCRILSWNGFSGKHPKNVSDGIMFNLHAIINDKKISASGSENFPKHYREFTNGLNEILRENDDRKNG